MNILTFFRLGAAITGTVPPDALSSPDGLGETAAETAVPTLAERVGAVWDAVVYGVTWFFGNMAPAGIWALAGLAVVLAFFIYYWHCLKPRPHSLEWIAMAEKQAEPRHMTLTLRRHPMERRDMLPLLLVTAVYAFTAFFRLGSFTAPQTYTVFDAEDGFEPTYSQVIQADSVTFSFSQPVTVDKISYYTSLGTGTYQLEYSTDGVRWDSFKLDQAYNTLFKWQVQDLTAAEEGETPIGPITASMFRISAAHAPRPEGLWLAELALWCGEESLTPNYVSAGGEALFDEPQEWTAKSTYLNSSYFDEIYHPRTALEHLNNIYPYEVSHPPLGKLIISLGILLFGMVPFGWRFMGTLFGVLMLPILYIFLKNLFGKTSLAFCGTCLFAFDFMHLVQTRIATIDTYGVFFILVSYYFMYRWLSVPAGSKLRRSILPLFLCGLFWGIGCASKWTVVYAGAGLALLWLLGLIFKGLEWRQHTGPDGRPRFAPYAAGTAALSVVFFLLIPICIYTVSYFPYALARGNGGGFSGMLAELFSWPFVQLPQRLSGMAEGQSFFDALPDNSNPVDIMLKNQHFMFTYHQGVHTPHPYESYWYQWIFDGRPILYYRDLDYYYTDGVKSLFASFNNPLVSWAGLASFFAVLIQTVRRKCGKGLFILIAILSQFVPWLPIGRILFAYHYFPTVLFLVFAICYLMNDMLDRRRKGYGAAVYGFTGAAVVLYLVFYPALTGLYTYGWYNTIFLRWFPSWPL